MLHVIQRLWKTWAVLYQEPAVLNETIIPLSNGMVSLVILFSWDHGPVYRCMQLCSSPCKVFKGAYRMKQPVFLGWKAGYSWCVSTNLLFVLGQIGLMEWLGFPPLKSMSQEGCGRAVLFPSHSPGKFMAFWSGVISLLTCASIPVETGLWWIIDCVLKELEAFLFKVFCTCNIFTTLGVCLTIFFSVSRWANGTKHWSLLNGLEKV